MGHLWEKCLDSNCELFFESHAKMVNHYRIEHLGLTKLYRAKTPLTLNKIK